MLYLMRKKGRKGEKHLRKEVPSSDIDRNTSLIGLEKQKKTTR